MTPATIAAHVAAGRRTARAILTEGGGADRSIVRRDIRLALATGAVESDGLGEVGAGAFCGHVLSLPGAPAVTWEALLLAPLLDADELRLLRHAYLADADGHLTTLGQRTVDLAEHLMGLAPEESRPHLGSAVARAVAGHRPGREQRMAIMEGPNTERREELRRLTRPVYREVMTSPAGLGVAAIIAPAYEAHEALARAVLDGLVHRLIAAGEL